MFLQWQKEVDQIKNLFFISPDARGRSCHQNPCCTPWAARWVPVATTQWVAAPPPPGHTPINYTETNTLTRKSLHKRFQISDDTVQGPGYFLFCRGLIWKKAQATSSSLVKASSERRPRLPVPLWSRPHLKEGPGCQFLFGQGLPWNCSLRLHIDFSHPCVVRVSICLSLPPPAEAASVQTWNLCLSLPVSLTNSQNAKENEKTIQEGSQNKKEELSRLKKI